MRVSQNDLRELRPRNFTSPLFKDWIRMGVLKGYSPANLYKVLLDVGVL
jgi:hypothetical protein